MPADSLPVQHLFTLTAETSRVATIAGGPAGTRVVVDAGAGTFEGPAGKGTILAPGGDWLTMRPDGSRRLDVRLLLRTDDGADILMTYTGIGTEDGIRTAPQFETGDERYAWLNRVQAVATGSVVPGGVAYEVYRLL